MLYVVTSSLLFRDNFRDSFIERLENIISAKPDRIILREKHLSEKEYFELAEKCKDICNKYNVEFSVNSFVSTAEKLSADLHIPIKVLEENPVLSKKFNKLGVSVHSIDEAVKAEKLGADYIIAGHIFSTDCKKGLLPRGTDFLRDVCRSVKIPVFAIGGITLSKIDEIKSCGAAGVCVMSHFMTCDNVFEEVKKFIDITDFLC